jgi:pimeloyl-ACP methyl ester carboxylesterase
MTITPVKTKLVTVPHLGGIEASTYMPHPYDSKKPTLVLCNSFGTSADLYRHQYQNKELNQLVNLLAIELLGHGQTRTRTENFTYWDSCIMNLQVLDALKIQGKVFVLGTSQGGWQTVRMALLAPERVSDSCQSEQHQGHGVDYCKNRSLASSRSAHPWTLKMNEPSN